MAEKETEEPFPMRCFCDGQRTTDSEWVFAMKFVKYTKYVPNPFGDLSAEDLLQLLQDFLLESGFYNQYSNFDEMDPARTMEQLHQALLEALQRQGKISEDLLRQMFEKWEEYQKSELADRINQLLQQLAEEGYITIEEPNPGQSESEKPGPGQMMEGGGKAKFEVTDKALDFLGF